MFSLICFLCTYFYISASVHELVVPVFPKDIHTRYGRYGIDDQLKIHHFKKDETLDLFCNRMVSQNKHIIRIFEEYPSGDNEVIFFDMIKTENQLQLMPAKKNVFIEILRKRHRPSVRDNDYYKPRPDVVLVHKNNVSLFEKIFSLKCDDLFFLVSYYNKADMTMNCFSSFAFRYDSKDQIDNMDIFSWDNKEKTFVCVDSERDFEWPHYSFGYADCYYLEHEHYKDLYVPIAYLKKIKMIDSIGILKNISLVLKNILYDAYGNRRLQKSLFLVFLANAHAPIAWLCVCYYSLSCFIFSKLLLKGLSHVGIIDRFVLFHFALHLFFNSRAIFKYKE